MLSLDEIKNINEIDEHGRNLLLRIFDEDIDCSKDTLRYVIEHTDNLNLEYKGDTALGMLEQYIGPRDWDYEAYVRLLVERGATNEGKDSIAADLVAYGCDGEYISELVDKGIASLMSKHDDEYNWLEMVLSGNYCTPMVKEDVDEAIRIMNRHGATKGILIRVLGTRYFDKSGQMVRLIEYLANRPDMKDDVSDSLSQLIATMRHSDEMVFDRDDEFYNGLVCLVEHGAIIKSSHLRAMLLHYSPNDKSTDCIKYLVEHGAKLDEKDMAYIKSLPPERQIPLQFC